jgi:hypothetical protein
MMCGLVAILAPTGSFWWDIAVATAAIFLALNWFIPKFSFGTLIPGGWFGKAAPDTGKP